jgi:hypothetical protein
VVIKFYYLRDLIGALAQLVYLPVRSLMNIVGVLAQFGLEHLLDRQGVTGSSPVHPTS